MLVGNWRMNANGRALLAKESEEPLIWVVVNDLKKADLQNLVTISASCQEDTLSGVFVLKKLNQAWVICQQHPVVSTIAGGCILMIICFGKYFSKNYYAEHI